MRITVKTIRCRDLPATAQAATAQWTATRILTPAIDCHLIIVILARGLHGDAALPAKPATQAAICGPARKPLFWQRPMLLV